MPNEVAPLVSWFRIRPVDKERFTARAWIAGVVALHELSQRLAVFLAQVVSCPPEGYICQSAGYLAAVVGKAVLVRPSTRNGIHIDEHIVFRGLRVGGGLFNLGNNLPYSFPRDTQVQPWRTSRVMATLELISQETETPLLVCNEGLFHAQR